VTSINVDSIPVTYPVTSLLGSQKLVDSDDKNRGKATVTAAWSMFQVIQGGLGFIMLCTNRRRHTAAKTHTHLVKSMCTLIGLNLVHSIQ
jgi:hypothetical protein